MKKSLSVAVAVIFVLILLLVPAYFYLYQPSLTQIKVVSPSKNYRIGEPYHSSYSENFPITLYYNGPDPEVIAKITFKSMGEWTCVLKARENNDCGEWGAIFLGDNNYQVEATTSSGQLITQEIVVSWEPYSFFENIIYHTGMKNLGRGYMVLSLVIFLVLAFVVMAITKSLGITIVAVWSWISIVTFFLISKLLDNSALAFYFIVIAWSLGAILIWWKLYYLPHAPAPRSVRPPIVTPRAPETGIVLAKGGTALAHQKSSSLEVINGEVKE